jgi:solute carrier family 38 (sodium-coupled neutral amino acid transporter), member 11
MKSSKRSSTGNQVEAKSATESTRLLSGPLVTPTKASGKSFGSSARLSRAQSIGGSKRLISSLDVEDHDDESLAITGLLSTEKRSSEEGGSSVVPFYSRALNCFASTQSTNSSPESSEDLKKTSVLMTALNFANGVIGAGIIGLPAALSEAGFLPGILLCILVAIVSSYTIRLLSQLGNAHNASTYEELAQRAFGSAGFYIICTATFLFSFGAMISYLIILADTIPAVFMTVTNWSSTAPILVNRQFVLSILAFVFVLPLSFLRNYALLAKLAVIKMVAILFLVITVVVYYPRVPKVETGESSTYLYVSFHSGFFSAVGTIAFAFVCHHMTFMAYRSLINATTRRFGYVVHLAIFFSTMLSLIMAVFGYLTFLTTTEGDIFVNYTNVPGIGSEPLINIARLLLGINMIFTFPGELFICRHTIEALIEKRRSYYRWLDVGGRGAVHDPKILQRLSEVNEAAKLQSADFWNFKKGITRPLMEHVLLTLVLFWSSLGIALSTQSLGFVLEITGATTAVIVAFVFPAAIRLRLGPSPDDTLPLLHWNNCAAWFVLIFGVFSFIASTTSTVAGVFIE